MHRIRTVISLVLLLIAAMSWGQTDTQSGTDDTAITSVATSTRSATIAIADALYPVTPGDSYTLSYTYGGERHDHTVSISSDYQMNLGQFGMADTADMTYLEAKESIETIINTYHPGSHPSLVLETPAEFFLSVEFEGGGTQQVLAWGLTRISDVIDALQLDERFSRRRIVIEEKDGTVTSIDHYDAIFHDSPDGNPLVRPGQTLHFEYSSTILELTGAVMEPGIRELAPGDTREDVIRYFGGFQPNADTSRIQRWQITGDLEEYKLLDWNDPSLFNSTSDRIRIHIPMESITRNVLYVEINLPPAVEETQLNEASENNVSGEYIRISIPVFEGMLVSDVVDQIEPHFNHMSDLRNSYISRSDDTEPIRVNIEEILHNPEVEQNIAVHPNDVLGVPTRTVFVTVSGGVNEPGRYYFSPMQTVDYYLTLAGGVDSEQNLHRNITIFDKTGEMKDRDAVIEPGDSINVITMYVTVTGAVYEPGRYDFSPMRTADYYVTLAGGINPEQNSYRNITVYDQTGKTKDLDEFIEPGDSIFVVQDNMTYQFNQKFLAITTGLTFLTTLTLLIISLTGGL